MSISGFSLEKWPITHLKADDKGFPAILKEIPSPPFQLFLRGAPLDMNSVHVAVVGTRMATQYGLTMAEKIARNIAECGGIVVSGLAFGVDAVAHSACVKAKKPTVAVLASGLNNITPRSNFRLAQRILETGGTLISEYEKEGESYKSRYAERNRIISGLSSATIVVEAGQISGALITARHAFEQNRDVYALPGDITRPQARGCFKLIDQDMAKTITCIPSLIKDLGFDTYASRLRSLTTEQLSIYELLKKKPVCADEITEKLNMPPDQLLAMLGLMEIKGYLKKDFSGLYSVRIM